MSTREISLCVGVLGSTFPEFTASASTVDAVVPSAHKDQAARLQKMGPWVPAGSFEAVSPGRGTRDNNASRKSWVILYRNENSKKARILWLCSSTFYSVTKIAVSRKCFLDGDFSSPVPFQPEKPTPPLKRNTRTSPCRRGFGRLSRAGSSGSQASGPRNPGGLGPQMWRQACHTPASVPLSAGGFYLKGLIGSFYDSQLGFLIKEAAGKCC